ncbi:MAG: SAM-dependent methyltransferase, partial [Myxococcales bacterium]|nr:SAM-dependent methyltransferase [Myxococcales bacterium]
MMTPEAKKALSATVRALRERLITDLSEGLESTWRLQLPLREAGLSDAATARRRRLEDALDEQARGERAARGKRSDDGLLDRLRAEVVQRAASTWLHRLVVLRMLEASGRRKPAVVTGAWKSPGYGDFRALAPALVKGDPTEGMLALLRLVFEELEQELPGLFGPQGVTELVPMGAGTLRHLLEALDDQALATCWTDDMTLGWVYQYW